MSLRNSTRVIPPAVRVGPPRAVGPAETPAGRVFPAWPLSLVGSAFPFTSSRGSAFLGRPRRVYCRLAPGSVIFPWDRPGWELVERIQLPRHGPDARRVTPGAVGPSPRGVPRAAPGLRGGQAAASPGHKYARRAHAALGRPTLPGLCHPRRRSSPRPSRPQSTALYLLQAGLTSGRGQSQHREPQNTQPQRQACSQLPPGPSPFSLQPCLPSQNNNKPPQTPEGHLTCQSPILARIDILAAGSESPGPCWSWTARASHSPGTPVGKSSPYLSRDSLTWP